MITTGCTKNGITFCASLQNEENCQKIFKNVSGFDPDNCIIIRNGVSDACISDH